VITLIVLGSILGLNVAVVALLLLPVSPRARQVAGEWLAAVVLVGLFVVYVHLIGALQ